MVLGTLGVLHARDGQIGEKEMEGSSLAEVGLRESGVAGFPDFPCQEERRSG